MSTEAPLSADDEFTNFVRYFANRYRAKELGLLEAIECREVTTEEERDEFLIRTEPLQDGFDRLPKEKQSIIEVLTKREDQEDYSESIGRLSGRARETLGRKGELSGSLDPRIIEFVEDVAAFNNAMDRLAIRLRAKGYEGDDFDEAFEISEIDSGDYVDDMDSVDGFILKARGIVGEPAPIPVPPAPLATP